MTLEMEAEGRAVEGEVGGTMVATATAGVVGEGICMVRFRCTQQEEAAVDENRTITRNFILTMDP